MYKFRKHVGKPEFPDHFSKIAICYKGKWYNIYVIKQSVCLTVNPITVDHFPYLFKCTPVGRGSVQTLWWSRLKNYSLGGLCRNVYVYISAGSPEFNCFSFFFFFLFLLQYSSSFVWTKRSPNVSTRWFFWVLCFILGLSVIYLLPVMIHGWNRRPPHGPNKFMSFHNGSRGRVGSP